MTNFEFLLKYKKLQDQIWYDKSVDLGFAKLGYCEKDPSEMVNLAFVNSVLTQDQLNQIEKQFALWQRKPAIDFERRSELSRLEKFLIASGYTQSYEDSWMFYDLAEINKTNFDQIREVLTDNDLEIFLATSDKCYQKNDPQNPYGELGSYLQVAREVWYKTRQSKIVNYYIAYSQEIPVAVSALAHGEGFGYIFNVGSLPNYRGKGYGKTATLFCVSESVGNRNPLCCLATEEGDYPNEFYKRIGFRTKFTVPLFVKK